MQLLLALRPGFLHGHSFQQVHLLYAHCHECTVFFSLSFLFSFFFLKKSDYKTFTDHLPFFLGTVKIRKWRIHSNSSLWEWSKVWTTFWFFSRQGESGVRWPPNRHSLDVFIQCWKGWRNHLSKFRGMAVVLLLRCLCFLKNSNIFYFCCQLWLLCLLQFKESQEKDDSWSDCAHKGYAGR